MRAGLWLTVLLGSGGRRLWAMSALAAEDAAEQPACRGPFNPKDTGERPVPQSSAMIRAFMAKILHQRKGSFWNRYYRASLEGALKGVLGNYHANARTSQKVPLRPLLRAPTLWGPRPTRMSKQPCRSTVHLGFGATQADDEDRADQGRHQRCRDRHGVGGKRGGLKSKARLPLG